MGKARKHPLARCEDCPFQDTGGFVPTLNLKPKAKIAVCGEAPGFYEATRGIPFTGPSGDLLNQVLKHHDINRQDIMITNVCLCRPENNDDPPKSAIAACAPRLHHEIESSGVDTIVAVGKVAAHAFLDERGSMKRLRVGPAKPYRYNPDINVIATWHPAYSLRSPDSFPDLVTDFGKIKGYDYHDWHEPVYRVFDDVDSARTALRELRTRFDRVVVDIECGVNKDISFVHPSEYDLLCVGFAYAPGRAVVIGENALKHREVQRAVSEVLQQTQVIAHNGKFDLAGLRNICGKQYLWFDTMLASYSLNERAGHHGLKQLSIERLGAPDYEADIRDYVPRGGNYADIPRDVLYRYNAYDVVCTWGLYELFLGDMSEDDRRKHDFLIRAANALIELELAGIGFDLEYNAKLAQEFLNELNDLEQALNDLVGYDFNPRSWQQILRYYQSKGYILPSTNAELLGDLCELLEGEVLDFTQQLLVHRKRAKLYGTYVKGLAKRVYQGKVYTTYLLHGTTSGRLASREPNLQNVPRPPQKGELVEGAAAANIRNQFVVEHPDHLFVQLDYKQAEGRVITTLARDEYLRAIFADPTRDLFTELNNDIYGPGKHGKEERVKIKSVFYGLAYGRGNAAIAKELDITIEESNSLVGAFKALIPSVIEWQNAIKRQVLGGEDLVTPYGRRRSFWLITDKNKSDVLNEALSFMPQSIASDICLDALVNLQPMLHGLATIRLTIHDAIVAECHKSKVDKVHEIMEQEMLASATRFTDYVPFEVDMSTGTRWGSL